MSGVAENLDGLASAFFRGFVLHPEWRGRIRLVAGGAITAEDIRAVEEASGVASENVLLPSAFRERAASVRREDLESPGALGAGPVTTVSEARAVLAEVTAERDELRAVVERCRASLRQREDNLEKAHAEITSLRDHGNRAVSALRDALSTFTRGSDGWARSAMVSPEDMDGWHGAALPWEGA
jgi:hypothetical protein